MTASHKGTSSRARRGVGDAVFKAWAWVMASVLLLVILLLVYALIEGSWLGLERYGLGFLACRSWNPVTEQFGALPAIFGTMVSSFLALALAGPIGLMAAIFLAEMAPPWLETPLSFLVELLASIPSVVYGLWGIYVLVPVVRDPVETGLQGGVGFLPLFGGPALGFGMLAAVLILAIMILPYITAVARDVIRVVPDSQREAMLALGATRWEVIWRAVVPYARSGIIGGIMLALGRAVGETMAVTMVIGNRPDISASLFSPAYTLASLMANEFTEATYALYVSVLIELGLVLFAITLVLNAAARLLVWRVGRGAGRL
ncbi:MAG: phosphate ABC transporter permease subunit PstC [Chloroflexi bacterium]|nr:phosphate ABC transporter permease subunit PstC [Chloroflexota bacterium]